MVAKNRLRLSESLEKLTRFVFARSGIASRWIDAGPCRVHVYDGRGKGDLPTFVLLHGLSASASSFAALIMALRPHVRRIIVPELPGHGFTLHPGCEVNPAVLESAIVTALDELLDEPAIVVGNSLGGALALHYADARPDRVRGLVLLSPAGARIDDAEWDVVRTAFRVGTRREARVLIDRIYHRPRFVVRALAHEFPTLLARPAVKEILTTATNEHAVTPEQLASLRMPVLFIWGRSERLLPHAAFEYFVAHLPPHAVVERPEGVGHVPQIDAPERMTARLLAFARTCVAARPPAGEARAETHGGRGAEGSR